MNRPVFQSVFVDEMNSYLDYKISSGHNAASFYINLRRFDRFCTRQEIKEPVFTAEHAERWMQRREDEATTTHYSRINGTKQFLVFLSQKGYDVFVIRDIRFKPTEFQPHIYTEDETRKYLRAVDAYESARNRKSAIQYPVLFRLLYCCGTRINETLGIRKQDVDLENGVIKLLEAKNNCERYIVLGNDLKALMMQFAEKCFYLLGDRDYIFTTSNGGRMSGDIIYEAHRLFLQQAGIPYLGGGRGPRIHDWRHTMAVRSFKQMIDSGMDMYVALPILSTYLGHKTIFATERYVRLTMGIYPYIEEKFSSKMKEVFGEGEQ
ncbi:tyrosine-type recombinase/integrase [Paenibacillus alkaliterrae]|uniref:tyrosine-type recombinase/integrase n=1 Tax=Paenibacillus alkaliterrae TaxID=320909 RepID=UPI001F308386|nr:tyrosine-type recombinase/integrase [Paenibacillus alkaliterrae]MCF2941902.1 tyrosine-type recombinase/integrase [Paenibacillus alkaliterrae]